MGRISDAFAVFTGRNEIVQRALSYQDVFAGGESTGLYGLGTGFEGSLRSVPLFAAVRLIVDQFAATPLQSFKRSGSGISTRAKDPTFFTPVTGTLTSWKTQLAVSMISGNAYGFITGYDGVGRASSIVWLNPYEVTCDENILRPEFRYQGQVLPDDRIVHIPWIVPPGRVTGLNPIDIHRGALETSTAAQELTRQTFANGGVPIGHLQNSEKVLSQEESDVISRRFEASTRKRRNFVSGKDWTYTTIGLTGEQVQYVEAMKLTATQIASLFGVPAEEIGGDTGSSLTYATVEMNSLKLATQTMRPYFVRAEDALSRLLPPGQYVKFNADATVRADLRTRYQAHEIALRTGLETLDEARALEERPPLTPAELEQYKDTYAKQAPVVAPPADDEQPADPTGEKK